MSPRKVGTLAAHLPPGAATWMAMGLDSGWPVEAQLMASAIDVLQWANYQRADGKGSKPDPVDRPADLLRRVERAEHHAERAARFLARRRERGGSE